MNNNKIHLITYTEIALTFYNELMMFRTVDVLL